jgi:hypothetical protein
MRKPLVILFSISIFVPFIIGAPDLYAEHTRNIFWCNIQSELNVVDLGIFIDTNNRQKLQIIHSGAKISTNQDDITGTATTVDINTQATTEVGLRNISTISIESNVRKICGKVGGITTSSVPANVETSNCTINAKDDFNQDNIKDGLNIQFLSMTSSGAQVVGILAGGTVSNIAQRVNGSLFGREYNAFIAEWSYSPVNMAPSHRETIAHNASRVCAANASSSVTPISGGTAPSGSSSGGGTSGGSGGTLSGGVSGGTSVSAEIKEGCFVKDKIEIKDSSGNTIEGPFENREVGPADTDKWGLICLVNTINSTTSWIFLVLMSIAFVLILVAAFFWATSGGNSEKQKKAGQMIAAALIGIVIALLSRIIPGVVTGILA